MASFHRGLHLNWCGWVLVYVVLEGPLLPFYAGMLLHEAMHFCACSSQLLLQVVFTVFYLTECCAH